MSRRAILVVAGDDSSGGAGVKVDRESAERLGVEALVCVTAFTVQGADGLRELGARPAERWLAEALAGLEREPGALKLGLLPGPEHVRAAARLGAAGRARLGPGWPVVWDPVLGPSRGGRFLDVEGVAALREALADLAPVLTPNLPELAELCGASLAALEGDLAARAAAAQSLLELGARAVVVKGGHGLEEPLIDLVVAPGGAVQRLARPRVTGATLRGTGCRHATALAVELAGGASLARAAERAGAFVAAQVAARGRSESR